MGQDQPWERQPRIPKNPQKIDFFWPPKKIFPVFSSLPKVQFGPKGAGKSPTLFKMGVKTELSAWCGSADGSISALRAPTKDPSHKFHTFAPSYPHSKNDWPIVVGYRPLEAKHFKYWHHAYSHPTLSYALRVYEIIVLIRFCNAGEKKFDVLKNVFGPATQYS